MEIFILITVSWKKKKKKFNAWIFFFLFNVSWKKKIQYMDIFFYLTYHRKKEKKISSLIKMLKNQEILVNDQSYCIDFDNYKKMKNIGRGKYGFVFLVKNKNTNEIFAAKQIPMENDISQQNIQREIEILIRCQHPIIVKFHGYSTIFDEENETYKVAIVMDYAKNGSLLNYLNKIRKKKDIDNTSLQIILIGIAYGMKYLHENNIIHRNLSSKNILLDENLYPLISDFGLSKIYEIGNSMEQSQNLFTPSYFPSEVSISSKYSSKSDVYSFSIIMYEIVTRLQPYPDLIRNPFYLIHRVSEGYRPEFKNGNKNKIKPSLKNLIELCWNQDPNLRPTFEQIFNMLAFSKEYENDENDHDEPYKYYLDNVIVIKSIHILNI